MARISSHLLEPAALLCAAFPMSGLVRQTTDERTNLYRWFDSLGYDAIRTGQFVKFDYKLSHTWSGGPPTYSQYGFLIEKDEKGFSVLTIDLKKNVFPGLYDGVIQAGTVQHADFFKWASDQFVSMKRMHCAQPAEACDGVL